MKSLLCKLGLIRRNFFVSYSYIDKGSRTDGTTQFTAKNVSYLNKSKVIKIIIETKEIESHQVIINSIIEMNKREFKEWNKNE